MKGGYESKPPAIGVKTKLRALLIPQETKNTFRKEIVMKRFASFLIVLVLVLSLTATAFATEGTGSITITNATKNDVYSLYKIFDASYSTDANGNTEAVSYSIETDNQFFSYLFGADGTAENEFFTYNAETGAVTRKENTQNPDIVDYLTAMVRSTDPVFAAAQTETADDETLAFTGLPYGYYLIDKGVGSVVTIDSNTPDVQVIDKNQIPGTDFLKQVWDEDSETWVSDSTANIGDIVDFKVEFDATNYDGEEQIKYYTVKDTKGSALWVEFDNITVTVGGTTLTQGYYHCANPAVATGEWDYLGTWTDEENPDNAQWYLIHHGYDEFDIVIPWMTGHDFTGTTNGFTLTYGDTAASKYDSPVDVVVEYSASVEPGATIGGAQNNNLWNTANLTWTSETTDGPDEPSTTTLTVYALGVEKIDTDTSKHLQGAVFELYSNAACTEPVYVIPTNIKGVYILDDLNTVVSGQNRERSRVTYAAYLEAYLGADYQTTQKNVVTSEANGKLVILGLEAGDYFLKETKAPDGYNALTAPVSVTVGQTNNSFFVIADAEGNVIDEQLAIEGYTQHNYTATSATVRNSKGVELPSTGGNGTMMLITIGTMLAMAFAVLLITHKKMSVYHD